MKKPILLITCAIFGGKMLFAMANNSQGVMLSSFIDAFRLESGVQGLPNAAANAGMLLSMLLAVSMAARVGKPALFVGGLGAIALMLALVGAAQSVFILVAAYLVMGFAFGCVDTTASALISDIHQGERASLMMGALHAAYGTGGILAPIALTLAMNAAGSWRVALWILAGVTGAAFIACGSVFRARHSSLPVQAQPPSKLSRADLRRFFGQASNRMIVLSIAFYCAHQCSIYLWISRIIGVGYGREGLGAAALSLFWVGTVISRLGTPLLGIGTVRYMRYGMLLSSTLLLISLLIGGAVPLTIAAALCGLIGGAAIPMTLSEITRRNPDMSMLSITAVLLTTALSAIICAPLIGFIVGKTSLLAGLLVSGAFALASGLAALGIRPAKTHSY